MWLKYGLIISVICCLICSSVSAYVSYVFTDNKWIAKVNVLESKRANASTNLVNAFRLTDHKIIKAQEVSDEIFRVAKTEQAASKRSADAVFDKLHNFKPTMPGSTSTNNNPSLTAERATAATDRLVLAELFRRADEAAGRYAEFAFESRIAGLDCERRYEIIKNERVRF